MDAWGYTMLVAGALVIGLAAQALVRTRFGYEWIATAIGAFIGGYLPAEYALGGLGQWGTQVSGLYIYPALIGALLVGLAVEVVIYFVEQPATA
ncbi:MAG TPA: hypothetical protein VFI42_13090 [Thermomicrobiaceae bacterium]|nr:hypothetical protein [Thermomicrobiaceae bacterium]